MWVWARGLGVRGWYVWGGFAGPGGDLLFHALRRSTIGAEGFHGRVRDGIGCFAPRYGHQAVQALRDPAAYVPPPVAVGPPGLTRGSPEAARRRFGPGIAVVTRCLRAMIFVLPFCWAPGSSP